MIEEQSSTRSRKHSRKCSGLHYPSFMVVGSWIVRQVSSISYSYIPDLLQDNFGLMPYRRSIVTVGENSKPSYRYLVAWNYQSRSNYPHHTTRQALNGGCLRSTKIIYQRINEVRFPWFPPKPLELTTQPEYGIHTRTRTLGNVLGERQYYSRIGSLTDIDVPVSLSSLIRAIRLACTVIDYIWSPLLPLPKERCLIILPER